MKKLLMILLALFASQAIAEDNKFLKTNLATAIRDRVYADATLDTTETIKVVDFPYTFITIQSKDSASIHIKYQLSTDATTWGVLTTTDSLSTGSNAGDVKTVNMSTIVGGAQYIRYVFDVQTFRLGTSTATYSAYSTLKK